MEQGVGACQGVEQGVGLAFSRVSWPCTQLVALFCRLFNFFLLFFFLSLFITIRQRPSRATLTPSARWASRTSSCLSCPVALVADVSKWLTAAARLLIVSTTGAGLATGLTMAGGNNVEAEAPMGVLAGLRALGATGEYYAHLRKVLVWACRALDASKGQCSLATRGLAHKWWCALVTCHNDEEQATNRARHRVDLLSRCCSSCSVPPPPPPPQANP